MIDAEMYGMMPRPKMVLWLRLPPENIETRPSRPSSEPRMALGHLVLVDDRQRDVEADAVDGQEQERDEDLLAQFRDLEDRDEPALPEGAQAGFDAARWPWPWVDPRHGIAQQ